jgi:metal-sulfur cluster biosynthetic enzyme
MDAAAAAITTAPLSQVELGVIVGQLVMRLRSGFDPEIPPDIYELGRIYKVDVSDDKDIDMTLTAPGRPVAGEIPDWVEDAAKEIPGLGRVKVDLVFDQTWDSSRMSDEAKLRLNGF